MKYLLKYEEFEEQAADAGGTGSANSSLLKKQDIVIGRDFFRELKVNIKYWFKFGRMSKKQEDHNGDEVRFELNDIEQTESDVTFWFTYFLNSKETYAWKVCYKLEKPEAEIESIKNLAVYFYCYDNDEVNIIKQMDRRIEVANDLKEKVFYNTIKDIVKTIIEEPKSDKEARDVSDSDNMTDGIY